jgi:hypothetical protein
MHVKLAVREQRDGQGEIKKGADSGSCFFHYTASTVKLNRQLAHATVGAHAPAEKRSPQQ